MNSTITLFNGNQQTQTFAVLDRLDVKTQQTARQFIAFFEGQIDLAALKFRLEKKPPPL